MILMGIGELRIFGTSGGSGRGILIEVRCFSHGMCACCQNAIGICVFILVTNAAFIARLLMLLTFYAGLSCFLVILMFISLAFICPPPKY
jgi:hypothetical protein